MGRPGWTCQDHGMLATHLLPCYTAKQKTGREIFSLFVFFPSPVSLACSSFFFHVSDKRAFMSSVNYVLWR